MLDVHVAAAIAPGLSSDPGTGTARSSRCPPAGRVLRITFALAAGLQRKHSAACPVHIGHIAKSALQSTAKLEMVDLIAHNKGTHERVA